MEFLTKLKLTFTQWAVVTATAIIGGLVFILRQQGRSLHKAKVELLRTQHTLERQKQSEKTKETFKRYQNARKEYEKLKRNILS